MTDLLFALNKTAGILGSAWLLGDEIVCDMGEAVGGADAMAIAKRAAEAGRTWATASRPFETAMFSAERGRLLMRAVGDGLLVVFADNNSAAGMVKVRMREIAEQIQAAVPERA